MDAADFESSVKGSRANMNGDGNPSSSKSKDGAAAVIPGAGGFSDQGRISSSSEPPGGRRRRRVNLQGPKIEVSISPGSNSRRALHDDAGTIKQVSRRPEHGQMSRAVEERLRISFTTHGLSLPPAAQGVWPQRLVPPVLALESVRTCTAGCARRRFPRRPRGVEAHGPVQNSQS